MGKDDLGKRLIERVGQTVLTCPTTACYDGLPAAPDRVGVGSALRFFGDGFQASKVIGGERFWRIPVMEGEFLVQEKFGMVKGVGGGNFLILARSADAALAAAEAAADAIAGHPGVILPFPGGVVRSGSKVGIAPHQEHDRLDQRRLLSHAPRGDRLRRCPTRVNSVLELVINGTDADAIASAMRARHRRRLPGRRGVDLGGELRRQARPAPLPPAEDHGGAGGMSGLRRPADCRRAEPADFSAVLAGAWTALAPAELARRPGGRRGSRRAAARRRVRGHRHARRHASASPATSAGSPGSAPASPRARVVVGGRRGRRGRARHGRRQHRGPRATRARGPAARLPRLAAA